jgi:GNAT superfamily N-acetyltransferase
MLAISCKLGYAFDMLFRIRPVLPSDRTQWEALWDSYQTFYKTKIPAQTTDITWARFFESGEPVYALVAEEGGSLIGLVHYLFHRSTWTAGPYCYLQDLFTLDAARGKGVGRALIEAVYAAAKGEGASRVHWLTHETNVEAKKLYDKVAQNLGFVQYRKDL